MFPIFTDAERGVSSFAPETVPEANNPEPSRKRFKPDWVDVFKHDKHRLDLDYLKRKNPLPSDDIVGFEEESHTYYYKEKKVNFQSVSKLIYNFEDDSTKFHPLPASRNQSTSMQRKAASWFDKIKQLRNGGSFDVSFTPTLDTRKQHFDYKNLIHLSGIEEIEADLFNTGKSERETEFIQSLNDVKMRDGWNFAAQMGTDIHAFLEARLNKNMNIQPPTNIPFGNQEYHQALNFLKDHEHVEFLRTEYRVYSEMYQTVGSMDFLYVIERDQDTNMLKKVAIGDFKRTHRIKKTYEEDEDYRKTRNKCLNGPLSKFQPSQRFKYTFQLGVYALLIEEQLNVEVTELIIVVFCAQNDNYIKLKVPYYRDEIRNTLLQLKEARMKAESEHLSS